MKILFATHRFPLPLLTGDRVRAYYFVQELAKSHEVFLLCPPPENPEDDEPLRHTIEHRIYIPRTRIGTGLRLASGFLSQVPFQTLAASESGYRRAAVSLIDRYSIDVGHVHMVRLAPILSGLQIPRFMDFMDTLSVNMEQLSNRSQGPKKLAASVESTRLKRYEQIVLHDYHAGSITANRDRLAMGSPDSVFVIPNGVPVNGGIPEQSPRPKSRIVFCGRMSYFPNVEGSCWFATQVLPIIRQSIPDAEFIIVGAAPDRRVLALAKLPGVQVLGFVESVTEELLQSSVAVAPMRTGTGIQNKVLEAMATGTPMVATPEALGDIAVQNGVHVSVARAETDFASAVLNLLQNPDAAFAQARLARGLVERDYSWESSADKLIKGYEFAKAKFKDSKVY